MFQWALSALTALTVLVAGHFLLKHPDFFLPAIGFAIFIVFIHALRTPL